MWRASFARPSRSSLDRKAAAASAAGLGIGIEHLERRASKILDKIDRGAANEVETDGIDNKPHSINFRNTIVALGRFGQFKPVGKSCASAAVDRKAQDRRLCLPLRDPGDALGCTRREANVVHTRSDRNAVASRQGNQ